MAVKGVGRNFSEGGQKIKPSNCTKTPSPLSNSGLGSTLDTHPGPHINESLLKNKYRFWSNICQLFRQFLGILM